MSGEFNLDRVVDPRTCKHERVLPAMCGDCHSEVKKPEPKRATLETIGASYNGVSWSVTIGPYATGVAPLLADAIRQAISRWERFNVIP